MVCTFFGHRDSPQEVKELLCTALRQAIEKDGVTTFYFGGQGGFDRMVKEVLMQMKRVYPHISCTEVLAYLPQKTHAGAIHEEVATIYPEGMEKAFPRFSVDARNRWMLEKAQMVVTCVYRSAGGAAKYKRLAEKQGKP